MYYAMIDWTAKKGNPGYGFANTKRAVCFDSLADRNRFVLDRSDWDYSCKVIPRREAMKMLELGPSQKGLYMYNTDDRGLTAYKVFRTSKYEPDDLGKVFGV